MSDDEWYSDEALRKQAALAALREGDPISLEMMCGVYQPRTQPTADERCSNCDADARDRAGGELVMGQRWCGLCIGRGRHE